MKIKLFLLIFTFTLSYVTGFSQTETDIKNDNIEFSVGYNSGSLKNLTFAPISRYDYNGLFYQLKYTRSSKNHNLFEIQLDYLDSELESDFIPILNVDYSKIVINFSYLKRIYNKNKFAIYVGLQSQSNVSSYINWDTYDFQQKLGIAGRVSFQLSDKQSLSSKLTLPFVMWRTSTFEEKLYSLNNYQSLFWNASYKYSLSSHFDLKINLNFNYNRLQISNAYRELQHQISLGINYKF